MNTRAKLLELGGWLDEKKAQRLTLIDLDGKHVLADGVVIASASSVRHARGLADFLLEKGKENNYEFLHLEGYQNGLWILLDFNEMLVNIMQPEQRELYRLEELFSEGEIIAPRSLQ
ncbi:MAG: ribosome silencing factor [Desulfovibrionaceae bacterium]|nr:ribosome silencing factor [Desulfovibrionaceae bacterium]